MLTTFNDDWLKKAMTGDELWVYGYDIDTKAIINHTNGSIQKSQYWKMHIKFSRMWKFCYFYFTILRLHELFPQGRTVNKQNRDESWVYGYDIEAKDKSS